MKTKITITGMHIMCFFGFFSLMVQVVAHFFFDVYSEWWGLMLSSFLTVYAHNELINRKSK